MKSQLEPIVLTNAVVSILLFSMLTLAMGTKIGDINVLQTWANAGSFANSISSRAYTSSDCFAYEGGMVMEKDGEIISERRVYPGVVDVRKFTEDNYFACIENYYSSQGSEVDYMSKNVPTHSFFLVNFKLYDLEEPQRIRQLGDTMSNEPQVDFSSSEQWTAALVNILNNMQWVLDVTSFGLSIAMGMITATTGYPIEVDVALLLGDVRQLNNVDKEVIDYFRSQYSSHTSRIPVVLRYVDDNGELITDHQGILETTIKYDSVLV